MTSVSTGLGTRYGPPQVSGRTSNHVRDAHASGGQGACDVCCSSSGGRCRVANLPHKSDSGSDRKLRHRHFECRHRMRRNTHWWELPVQDRGHHIRNCKGGKLEGFNQAGSNVGNSPAVVESEGDGARAFDAKRDRGALNVAMFCAVGCDHGYRSSGRGESVPAHQYIRATQEMELAQVHLGETRFLWCCSGLLTLARPESFAGGLAAQQYDHRIAQILIEVSSIASACQEVAVPAHFAGGTLVMGQLSHDSNRIWSLKSAMVGAAA